MSFLRVVSRCRQLGARCIPCISLVIYYSILRLRFGFERWHAKTPYPCHRYKAQCVDLIKNYISPFSVIELGCGLGEIIRKIPAPERIGLDIDGKVIAAAKYLNSKSNFVEFNIGDFNTISKLPGELDLLIMINWPHELSPDNLADNLSELLVQKKIKWLLVDEIVQVNNHRIRHNYVKILEPKYSEYARFGDDVGVRQIILFALNDS